MQEKIMQLSLGEKLVAGGGILLFLASFLDWFTFEAGVEGIASSSAGESGWGDPGSIWSLIAILVSIVLAGIVAAKLGNVQMPALPQGISWGMVFAAGAGIVIIAMLLKAWRITAVNACEGASEFGVSCSSGFGFGFYIAFIAAIILAAGGYLLYSTDKGAGFGGLRK